MDLPIRSSFNIEGPLVGNSSLVFAYCCHPFCCWDEWVAFWLGFSWFLSYELRFVRTYVVGVRWDFVLYVQFVHSRFFCLFSNSLQVFVRPEFFVRRRRFICFSIARFVLVSRSLLLEYALFSFRDSCFSSTRCSRFAILVYFKPSRRMFARGFLVPSFVVLMLEVRYRLNIWIV